MPQFDSTAVYDFTGKTIATTGAGGVLCSAMARGLAACNANVVLLERDELTHIVASSLAF